MRRLAAKTGFEVERLTTQVADALMEILEARGVVVVIHGGFWRPAYDRAHLRPLATALREEGRTVVSVEYRRVPGDPDHSYATKLVN